QYEIARCSSNESPGSVRQVRLGRCPGRFSIRGTLAKPALECYLPQVSHGVTQSILKRWWRQLRIEARNGRPQGNPQRRLRHRLAQRPCPARRDLRTDCAVVAQRTKPVDL